MPKLSTLDLCHRWMPAQKALYAESGYFWILPHRENAAGVWLGMFRRYREFLQWARPEVGFTIPAPAELVALQQLHPN